jgi:ethanolamine ammonia-lyase small subunit
MIAGTCSLEVTYSCKAKTSYLNKNFMRADIGRKLCSQQLQTFNSNNTKIIYDRGQTHAGDRELGP